MNSNHIKQINHNKNELLNFLAERNPNFYFHFLNQRTNIGNKQTKTRAEANGCHFAVTYFNQNTTSKFIQYEKDIYYYITFNCLSDNKTNERMFSLRKDLVDLWKHSDNSDKFVLIFDNETKTIYEIPIQKLLKKKSKQFCERFLTFSLTDHDNFSKISDFDSSEYIKTTYGYDPKYFDAKYIGNFVYTKYCHSTSVVVFKYDYTGKYVTKQKFEAIKEVYQLFKENGYNNSYKTLQRAAIDERLIQIGNNYFYLSMDLDEAPQELEVEVYQQKAKNPFYNKAQPISSTNPEFIIQNESYSAKKTTKDYTKDDISKAIEETIIDEFDEDFEDYLLDQSEEDAELSKVFETYKTMKNLFEDSRFDSKMSSVLGVADHTKIIDLSHSIAHRDGEYVKREYEKRRRNRPSISWYNEENTYLF